MTSAFQRILATTALIGVAAPLAAQDLIYPIGEGPYDWASYQEFADANDFAGETLTILGAGTGADKDRYQQVFDYFTAATGAEVRLSGSDAFEQDVVIAAQSDTMPDVLMFPQPGLTADLAARGSLVPLDPSIGTFLEENFAAGSSWRDTVTFPSPSGEDQVFATIFGADVKSLVWYVPEAFEEMGYETPVSMEALKALTEQIVEDGGTPWCMGLGSGAATGWPATDWVEDLVLRLQPPEVYDQWVVNEIPFDDPRIVEAIEEYGWFARNDAFVVGGARAVATTDFRDSPDGMFEFPPQCYLHKQASFIPTFFPDGMVLGEDVDSFYFPAYESRDLGQPVLGFAGVIALGRDRAVAHAFIDFLNTTVAHEILVSQGQSLTPLLSANPSAYTTDTQRALGTVLTNATTFRFDGSDLMPGEIGTDAFWSAMVAFQVGESAEEAAAGIQERWNSIR